MVHLPHVSMQQRRQEEPRQYKTIFLPPSSTTPMKALVKLPTNPDISNILPTCHQKFQEANYSLVPTSTSLTITHQT